MVFEPPAGMHIIRAAKQSHQLRRSHQGEIEMVFNSVRLQIDETMTITDIIRYYAGELRVSFDDLVDQAFYAY